MSLPPLTPAARVSAPKPGRTSSELRTRIATSRVGRAILTLVVTGLCVALMGSTAFAEQATPGTTAGVEPTAIDFRATNDVQQWIGGSVEGTLTVTIANTGNVAVTDVVGTALIGDRTLFLASVDLEAGQSQRVSVDVDLGGISLYEREIVATVGGAQVVTTNRSIPWVVVIAAAVAVNGVLLAARNQLRDMVHRRVEADTSRVPVRH